MHRTNNCASLFALHWLTRPNSASLGSKIDLPADLSRPIRSVIRDGMVKTQQSSTKEAAMSTKAVRTNDPTSDAGVATVAMKFEVVVIPVSDVDRAKEFYGRVGWRLDADFRFDSGFRVVQFTPPGSGCSIQFGANITPAAPGSAHGLYLIVSDIEAACDELVA